MIRLAALTAAVLTLSTVAPAPSQAANMCKTQSLSCATTMPVGGYCECTKAGNTEDGTVAAAAAPRRRSNATAGGCGAHPNNPGCR